MAFENSTKRDNAPDILRENILATIEALAAGKIDPKELAPAKGADERYIRYAEPGRRVPYTAESIANFLGEVDSEGEAKRQFRYMIAALDLQKRWVHL